MGTFIINLNDTTVLNDSVVVKVVKLAEVCQPTVIGVGTNSEDVAVANMVCATIAFVVLVLSAVFVICYCCHRRTYKGLKEKELTYANELKKTESAHKQKALDQQLEIEKNHHVESLKRANEERALKIMNELASIAGTEKKETIENYKDLFDNILTGIKNGK